jgi:hypothetical protein
MSRTEVLLLKVDRVLIGVVPRCSSVGSLIDRLTVEFLDPEELYESCELQW